MEDGFNDTVIDGYSGFIFSSRYGEAISPHCVNRAIERICRDYNAEETIRAKQEKDLKVIQEIMGHADITTTMNIYNEATKERKVASFVNLEGKIRVS